MITPLQNYILLQEVEKENKTGLIIDNEEKSNEGKVLAFGNEVKLPIKKGDVVLFKRHMFESLGNKQLIGKEEGIFAKK